MGMPAARVLDMHVCPMVTVLVPHVGGPILPPCMPTVLTGMLPQARVTDLCTCVGPPDMIVMGAFNVLVGGLPAARLGDMTMHGGSIVTGLPNVLIGMNPSGGAGGPGGAGGMGGMGGLGDALMNAATTAAAAVEDVALTAKETIFGVEPLSPEELAQANQAVADAKDMLAKSRAKTEAWDDDTKAQAKKWFGDDSDETKQMILDRIDKQTAHLDTMNDATFERASGEDRDVYAYVYPDDDSKMWLGTAFWDAPAKGDNSKAGTIVHETSHYDTQSGTQDHVYGHKDARDLAKKDPATAKNNADNMEYYIEKTGK